MIHHRQAEAINSAIHLNLAAFVAKERVCVWVNRDFRAFDSFCFPENLAALFKQTLEIVPTQSTLYLFVHFTLFFIYFQNLYFVGIERYRLLSRGERAFFSENVCWNLQVL